MSAGVVHGLTLLKLYQRLAYWLIRPIIWHRKRAAETLELSWILIGLDPSGDFVHGYVLFCTPTSVYEPVGR